MALELSEQVSETGLDGLLPIDKPSGWTSHDVVAKVRRLVGERKVGHAGTLDPAATGVLVLCLGKATRIAEYLLLADKTYRAILRLGIATDTQDATGAIMQCHSGPLPDEETIRSVMQGFVGAGQQVPPMYSAVKVKGVPLYKMARAGRTVSRASREYMIHRLTVLSVGPTMVSDKAPVVDVVFEVVCSKGTYVRTLCADIGAALRVGGHLAQLRRCRVGRFTLDHCFTLDELAEAAEHEGLKRRLCSLSEALSELPAFVLDPMSSESVRHGTGFSAGRILRTEGQWCIGEPVRLYTADATLLAIGKASWASEEPGGANSEAMVKIEKVLV